MRTLEQSFSGSIIMSGKADFTLSTEKEKIKLEVVPLPGVASVTPTIDGYNSSPTPGPVVNLPTVSAGGTALPVSTNTASPTITFTPVLTNTPMATSTPIPTSTGMATPTSSATPTFTATPTPTPIPESLLLAQTPVVEDFTDGADSDYELGMQFVTATDGFITAIRHWKSASETGAHTGRIWSTSGTLLASVTFSSETASGWQVQNLSSPLAVTAGVSYIVSVNVNTHYPYSHFGLSSTVTNGNLSAPGNGMNGLFDPIPGNFPTNSFNNSNYFRDVVFVSSVPTMSTQTNFFDQVPQSQDLTDSVPYELGIKFVSAVDGTITAIRHWKSNSETGAHVGRIWSESGTLLASVPFTGEGPKGWQVQALPTPLAISGGTTYVVSVNINSHYPMTLSGLASSVVRGDLSTVADGVNGVYNTTPGSFPTSSSNNPNYFRDVLFKRTN